MLTEQGSGPAGSGRPATVTAAFWIWLVVGFCVAAALLVLLTGSIWDEARAARAIAGDTEVDGIFTVYRVYFTAIFTIVFFIFLVLDLKMRAGRRYARFALPVVGGLVVLVCISGLANSIVISSVTYRTSQWPVWLICLLVLAGTVLMFGKASNRFFTGIAT